MANVKNELQQAIYTRLTSGTSKISFLVYESVPDNTKPPYVEIGRIYSQDWSTKKNQGFDMLVEFELWSIKNSNQELFDMEDAIMDSITVSQDTVENELTMTNHNCSYQGFEGSNSPFKDQDNRTRRLTLTLTFLTHRK